MQRVSEASVRVAQAEISRIGAGLLLLVGIGREDTEQDAVQLAEKVIHLRIFADEQGKMNLSALQLHQEVLVVSQFTLYADCNQGRRPYFGEAAAPELGERLYLFFCAEIARHGLPVQTGQFRSHMAVHLVNDGPVTLMLDSKVLNK